MKAAALPLLLLLATTAHADKADDLVKAAMAKEKIPGIMLVVLRDGKPIKTKGYGFANLEHRVPVRPETIFQSGSVGKMFAATLTMKLVEEGKLKLEDPIGKFFPEAEGKWDAVTIRHLLTHTSGLADMPYGTMDFRRDYEEKDLLKLMVDGKAVEKPGERWRYNNGGYVLLGILLGRVGGKFYGDQLVEKVFRPAGMLTARTISEEDIIPNRAAGYEIQKGEPKNQGWVPPKLNTTADGSTYFCANDLIAWDRALYGDKVLKQSSLAQMWTPVKLADGKEAKIRTGGYGFGWMMEPKGDQTLVNHGGAWQGFRTWIGRLSKDRLTVIVLSNAAPSNPEGLGRAVMDLYIKK
ncbi:MAG: serine hydrolase domain-containing protein [Fimbriimonas sp.]